MTSESLPDMIVNPDTFTADALFWLRAAQAAIRRECGWHVTPNLELQGMLNCRGGRVTRLPARHVTSIEELTDRDGNPLRYAYDPETGLIESVNGTLPVGVGIIRYRIHAGYAPEEVPDVQGVLINAAKRASMAAPGIIKTQTVNGSSVSYDITLMADELTKLKPYKLGALP